MSLLFSESPLISIGTIAAAGIGFAIKSNLVIGVSIFMLVFLLYFYRYCPVDIGSIDNNTILSPCEGTVLDIYDKHGYFYIPIFLSPMNKHTQIYPANCAVLSRTYDKTGEFAMVMNLSKSQNNEKKIHVLQMDNGAVISLTQIAGFLPRMITSDEELNSYKAGDYLGMIKFGSRVDLLIPKKSPSNELFTLDIQVGDKVSIADFIGKYQKIE